jgi:MFS family permease
MNPAVALKESTLIQRSIRWYDYITINIYFFGLTVVSQTNGLVFPLLIQGFVGDAQKASYLGSLRLWTLMVALLMQALMGLLSDRSTLPWGRRRPFIFIGSILNSAFLIAAGLTAGLSGMAGFSMLFMIAIMSQFASNMAHSAQQGLIPDLVPENKRGKFSGIKAVLEVPLPLILVSFTIGRVVAAGNLMGGILIAVGVLLAVMLVTMFVPEKPLKTAPPPFNWAPIIRLGLMTILFTVVILLMGFSVRQIGVWAAQNIVSSTGLYLIMGISGLAAMLVAIAFGVYFSVRISIGRDGQRKNPSFTWWVINRLAFLVGAFNLSTFAVFFIQGRLGYIQEAAAGPAAILIMITGVCILISALPSGWLADRFGRKPLIAISGIVAFVGTIIALSVPSLTMIYIGASFIGLATGFFFSANWALGTDIVPKDEAARYLGISNLAGAGAGAVGAYIGGPIADYFTAILPGSPGAGYILLFVIYGSLFLLSVLALPWIKTQKANAQV